MLWGRKRELPARHAGAGTARPLIVGIEVVAAAAVPWSWFVTRDVPAVDQLLDIVALAAPLVVLAAVAVAVIGAVLRRRLLVVTAASTVLVGVAAIIGPWRAAPTGVPVDAFRLVAANVYGGNLEKPALARKLMTLDADVVVTMESIAGAHEVLAAEYPYVVVPRPHEGVGIYSRLPVRGVSRPLPGTAVLRVVLEARTGPVALYATHLPRPSVTGEGKSDVVFFRHRALVDRLIEALADDPLATVVAGDLNTSDRTSGYRALRALLRDAMRAHRTGPTSTKTLFRPLLLRIDHVLVPRHWCGAAPARVDLPGTDHLAVLASIGPCRPDR